MMDEWFFLFFFLSSCYDLVSLLCSQIASFYNHLGLVINTLLFLNPLTLGPSFTASLDNRSFVNLMQQFETSEDSKVWSKCLFRKKLHIVHWH